MQQTKLHVQIDVENSFTNYTYSVKAVTTGQAALASTHWITRKNSRHARFVQHFQKSSQTKTHHVGNSASCKCHATKRPQYSDPSSSPQACSNAVASIHPQDGPIHTVLAQCLTHIVITKCYPGTSAQSPPLLSCSSGSLDPG